MFGADFTTWMAWIGGYPTLLTTGMTIVLVGVAGVRIIWRYEDIKTAKFHIQEVNSLNDQIIDLLKSTKPLTRWRFKRLVGEQRYLEFVITDLADQKEIAAKPAITEKQLRKELKKAKKKLKRIEKAGKLASRLAR